MNEDGIGSGLSTDLAATLDELRGLTVSFTGEISEATSAIKTLDGESQKLSRSLSSSLRTAFDKAVFGGEKMSTVFRDLASSFAGKALDAALKPVTDSVAGGFTNILGNLSGALGSAFGFSSGGVFTAGRVQAFARGGVVGGPTFFPMRGGTGLMGEAGPEAIMPLSRGPDGKLGVAASGAASNAAPIVINIQTPDPASFQRSRSQISAQLARAVRQGQSAL